MENSPCALAKTIEAEHAAFVAKVEEIEDDILTLAYGADAYPQPKEIKFIETALLGARQLLLLGRQAACGIPAGDPANSMNIFRVAECMDVLVECASSEPRKDDEEEGW